MKFTITCGVLLGTILAWNHFFPADAPGASARPPAAVSAPTKELLVSGDARHVTVYRVEGRYGGWPANHGIWAWGNEILVGFSAGYMKVGDGTRHPIDRTKPEEHFLARSLDGGEGWAIEKSADLIPPPRPGHIAGVPTEKNGRIPQPLTTPIDFAHPDLALTFRMGDIHTGPSWFYYSLDRGHAWRGPYVLSKFGQAGIAARTDYLVTNRNEALALITSAKADGKEGRVLAARTKNGGVDWELASWVGPEPAGFSIMPSSVRLSDTTIVTAIRRREGTKHHIELYRSTDNGASWSLVSVAAPDTGRGNPGSLIRLKDGRLCLTYGYRAEPYGMRARLSADLGETWGPEIVLRQDAADWDLGYPRSVQRPDGKVVTVYYYNDRTSTERYIAATIWTPIPASPGTGSK